MSENFVIVSSAEQARSRFQCKLGEQNVLIKSTLFSKEKEE